MRPLHSVLQATSDLHGTQTLHEGGVKNIQDFVVVKATQTLLMFVCKHAVVLRAYSVSVTHLKVSTHPILVQKLRYLMKRVDVSDGSSEKSALVLHLCTMLMLAF